MWQWNWNGMKIELKLRIQKKRNTYELNRMSRAKHKSIFFMLATAYSFRLPTISCCDCISMKKRKFSAELKKKRKSTEKFQERKWMCFCFKRKTFKFLKKRKDTTSDLSIVRNDKLVFTLNFFCLFFISLIMLFFTFFVFLCYFLFGERKSSEE